MPANTKQSKQVYLTLKPAGNTARGTPQHGRPSENGVDEMMYTTERGKENDEIGDTLSSFEKGGELAGNSGIDSGVIGNFHSKPVYINLKTPEKQGVTNGKSFEMEGDSFNGWNLLEALKNLSPLRRRKAQQDMWSEEEIGQRAAFQNDVELNVTPNVSEDPGSEGNGGELRRSEVYINLGSPTTEAHPHTVDEALLEPPINCVEELQTNSSREFIESSNSQTTVLVNYDLGNCSTGIAPASIDSSELLEDADNDVALKDYIFYVQVKDPEVEVNPDDSTGIQNVVTLQKEKYHEEVAVITVGDQNLIDQEEGLDQGNRKMKLSDSDSEGGPPIASSDEGDDSLALRSAQVSHLNVVLRSQGNDTIESGLFAGMLEDKCDSGTEADDMTVRDERQQGQYLSVKDSDRLRSSSWISLDNVHVTRLEEVSSSPYPDSQQIDYTVVERIVQPIKSKPLFVTLKPASGIVGVVDTSVDSEEISMLPSLNEMSDNNSEEVRPYDSCGIDVERSEYEEKVGTMDTDQVELVSQTFTLPEMKVYEDVDTDDTNDFVDGRGESDVERGQEVKQTGITITLKSQMRHLNEEVDMVGQSKQDLDMYEDVENEESKKFADERDENGVEQGQEMKHTGVSITLKSQNKNIDEKVHMICWPEEETEVYCDETKEFADGSCGKEGGNMERGREMKQSGITITLKPQIEKTHEEEEVVCQSEYVKEVYEEVGRDDVGEFVNEREENEVEMKQELKQTGVMIILKPPKKHIQQEREASGNVLDTIQREEFSVNKSKEKVAREPELQKTGTLQITLKSQNRPSSYGNIELQQESEDGQITDLKDQERAVGEECERDVVLTGDENHRKLSGKNENQQSLEEELDDVKQISDDSEKEYFRFPSRAEYLRSKIRKAMKSNIEKCVDKRSIVYDNRQEMQTGTLKSERIKELLRRLGRDGESTKEVTSRQMSENASWDDCSSTSVDTDHSAMQTSSITFTLRAINEQHSGYVVDSSICDRDHVREMTSHQSRDDHGMGGVQHSQCLDFNNDIGYEDHDGIQTSKISLNLQQHIDQPVEEAVDDLGRVEDDMQIAVEQMVHDQDIEMLQNSYCLDLNNDTRVEESVQSSSVEEVASILMSESGSHQNDDVTLVLEIDDNRQTWKGDGGNVKSETVYIRLKPSNEKQLHPAYLLSGNHAGSKGTDNDGMSQKDVVRVDSKSPSKLKMLNFGVKKRLEQFGEQAAGVVGDIAESSKELAKSVVKKGKNTTAHPELREVVLSRLRSMENGDKMGDTASVEEKSIVGRKMRRVKSLFTPEEQLTLASAADHVDATSIMEMMSSLVPDLASRVRGAEFEDEVREQVMKMVEALQEWKPTINRGKSKTNEEERERHGLSEMEESCRQEVADESQAVGRDEITNSRIVEALMRLKLSKEKGEVETGEEALESSGILDVFKMMSQQCEEKGAAIQEADLKVKEALMGLKPKSWNTPEDDDVLKMKDILMNMKPDSILREIASMGDGVEKLQLSETLKSLVPDFGFGRHEDSQDGGGGDFEMAKVIGMLKKLKPNLDSANLGTDEDRSVMQTLKRLRVGPRLQTLKKDLQVGSSSLATEALGTMKSVLSESGERVTLTVDEFSRMRDALGTLLPHWHREHEDVEEESSSAIAEALLSLKPNLSGEKGDEENSKMKDFFVKLATAKGKENSDSNQLECEEEKVGMMQALRDMIAPRRPANIELKVQEAEEDTPEDGIDASTYQKDKSFESRETEWSKVGKLLKNLLTFGASSEEDDRVVFLSDDENEGLLIAERATDITEARVKEAMLKLKGLDGKDEELEMSSLKKPGWLRALIDIVLGDNIKYQYLPSEKEVLIATPIVEIKGLPGTSKDEGAVVHETNVEASTIPSPIDHFKARESLQSLNEAKGGTNQGTSNYRGPWKIFAMSRISKKKDGDSTDDVVERERNEERGKNGGLMKGIDIVGLAHPYISKRKRSSLSSGELKDKNGKTGHIAKGRPEQQDENVYLTFKMTYLSGFSPVSSRNVIVHDAAVMQKCLCSSFPFIFAIRNYVMTDADIARNSADGDGFLIISGDGDASLNVEVQEDIVALKVGDEEEKSGREEVNMDELADMLNGDDVQAEQEDEDKSVEPEPEGEVVTEEHIAEVKVGGVEAGVSIQWPGGEEEQTEETAADNDETEKVEETEEVGESEKIEDEYVHVGEDEETQKQGEVLIDVQLNGEAAEEIIEEIKDEVNLEEEAETPAEPEIPAEPDTLAEPEIPAEPDTPAEVETPAETETPAEEEVVEDKKEEEEDEERPVGNVAIEITLGETAEEKKEEKEEVTENEPVVSQSKRSTSKLDNTKMIKYQGSIDEADSEPVKPVKGAGRLDMSRFSLFQKKSAGSEPPKKNFTIKPVVNKNRFGSQGPSSTDTSNKCLACEKRVYPMDKVAVDGKIYHKYCFRCTECKKVLSVGTYATINSLIFCKPHFKQRFKMYGDYTTGFSQGSSLKSPSTAAVNNSS